MEYCYNPAMLTYPDIDPIMLQIGDRKIHWYGMMYLVAFTIAWFLGTVRAKRPNSGWRPEEIADVMFYGALGVIIGGRLGYTFFYNFDNFVKDPIILFKLWEGGMSFHGGVLACVLALWVYARRTKRNFFVVTDFVVPLIPLGYGAGRLGNFINGELWGRVTDVPWGMVFPHVDNLPRHPSQLYQIFFGGICIFIVMWWYSSKPRPRMAVSGLFLTLFGCYRFFVEFFRQPDAHLNFIAFNWMTMGQLLSVPLVGFGAFLLWKAYQKSRSQEAKA